MNFDLSHSHLEQQTSLPQGKQNYLTQIQINGNIIEFISYIFEEKYIIFGFKFIMFTTCFLIVLLVLFTFLSVFFGVIERCFCFLFFHFFLVSLEIIYTCAIIFVSHILNINFTSYIQLALCWFFSLCSGSVWMNAGCVCV